MSEHAPADEESPTVAALPDAKDDRPPSGQVRPSEALIKLHFGRRWPIDILE